MQINVFQAAWFFGESHNVATVVENAAHEGGVRGVRRRSTKTYPGITNGFDLGHFAHERCQGFQRLSQAQLLP